MRDFIIIYLALGAILISWGFCLVGGSYDAHNIGMGLVLIFVGGLAEGLGIGSLFEEMKRND